MAKFSDQAAIDVGGDSGPRPTGAVTGKGTPREQAERTAYRDDTGNLYFPASNVFSGLIEAGAFQKSGKRQLTTARSSQIPGMIGIRELTLPLGTKKFETDSRRIVNGVTGGARIAHRARLDKWRLAFTIEFDPELINESQVRQLVDDLGKRIGIGAYRPARKGPFGKFRVTKWAGQR